MFDGDPPVFLRVAEEDDMVSENGSVSPTIICQQEVERSIGKAVDPQFPFVALGVSSNCDVANLVGAVHRLDALALPVFYRASRLIIEIILSAWLVCLFARFEARIFKLKGIGLCFDVFD